MKIISWGKTNIYQHLFFFFYLSPFFSSSFSSSLSSFSCSSSFILASHDGAWCGGLSFFRKSEKGSLSSCAHVVKGIHLKFWGSISGFTFLSGFSFVLLHEPALFSAVRKVVAPRLMSTHGPYWSLLRGIRVGSSEKSRKVNVPRSHQGHHFLNLIV